VKKNAGNKANEIAKHRRLSRGLCEHANRGVDAVARFLFLLPFSFCLRFRSHHSRSTICYPRLPFNALPFQPQRDETLGNAKHFLNIGECCHWIVVVVH